MQKISTFLLSIFLLTACSLQAQEPVKSDLKPCGTSAELDPWLLQYMEKPYDFPDNADTLYVGMQVHLLAKDNGTGRFSAEKMLAAMCRLNADFAQAGIRFYFKNDWDLINNTGWYQHDDIPKGVEMMLANDVPGAVNAYFVSDPAGNCGYSLPYAGVAISHACAGSGDHTWAHEVGHNLTLPHPFRGWEGKTYNFNNPTPDTVTYDYTYFHAQPDTAQTPPDTTLTERLDGSNCGIAADYFCDTKADYLSYRWECNDQNLSVAKEKDANGEEFYSDGTLFMSYSYDQCQNRFSDQQIAAMRANLLNVKPDHLVPAPLEGPVGGLPTLLEPIGSAPTPPSGFTLRWTAVPGATHYIMQGTRIANFSAKEFESVTSDTFFTITAALAPNMSYYWRVRPFNNWDVCSPPTAIAKFVTSLSETESPLSGDGWRCYPTLLAAGQSFVVEAPEAWRGRPAQCRILDAAGRTVWSQALAKLQEKTVLQWPSADWPAGVYELVVVGEQGMKAEKILLH